MTPAALQQRCAAAGLDVLSVETVRLGTQVRVCVTVAPYDGNTKNGRTHTVVEKLGVPVTISFGDGSGNVRLWFEAGDGE